MTTTVQALSTPEAGAPFETVEIERRDLRPDDWHRRWPELVDVDHPAPTEKAAAECFLWDCQS